jgi:Ca2+-binding EF-hand superfamily protein
LGVMPRKAAVPEVLSVKVVQYVKEAFHKADKDGGGDLDEEEFVSAFTGRLNTDEGSDKVICTHRNCLG